MSDVFEQGRTKNIPKKEKQAISTATYPVLSPPLWHHIEIGLVSMDQGSSNQYRFAFPSIIQSRSIGKALLKTAGEAQQDIPVLIGSDEGTQTKKKQPSREHHPSRNNDCLEEYHQWGSMKDVSSITSRLILCVFRNKMMR